MNMSINFPNLGIHLGHVGKTISIFGFEIAYYGIVIAAGMMLAIWLILAEAKRTGQNDDNYFYMLIVSIAVGIVGARVYYVAFRWSYYSQNLSLAELVNTRNGGLAIYGGIIFGVISACIFARVKKMPLPLMLDTACLGLPVGQLMGRWGNFFNREAFGEYTNGLFAMQLPVDAVRQNEITEMMWDNVQTLDGVQYIQVHPTFLYESLWCLCLLCLLLWLRKHKMWNGQVFLTYLGGYALGRVWIEGLRTDQLWIPGTQLPVSQVLSAAIVVVCVVYAIWKHRRMKQGTAQQ